MESIYYWTGFVIVWLIMMPIASVCAIMALVWLHKKSMEAFFLVSGGNGFANPSLIRPVGNDKGRSLKAIYCQYQQKEVPTKRPFAGIGWIFELSSLF